MYISPIRNSDNYLILFFRFTLKLNKQFNLYAGVVNVCVVDNLVLIDDYMLTDMCYSHKQNIIWNMINGRSTVCFVV